MAEFICQGLLNFLRTLPKFGVRKVPGTVVQDILWWLEFAQTFNGVALIPDKDWSSPNHVLSSDSCLMGGGGYAKGKYYHWQYNSTLIKENLDINQLECLNIIVCLKLWGMQLKGKKLVLLCDNSVTVQAINTGTSKNVMVQKCLREIHKTLACHSVQIKMQYLEGAQNRISDALSRWHIHPKFEALFNKLTKDVNLTEFLVKPELWEFIL